MDDSDQNTKMEEKKPDTAQGCVQGISLIVAIAVVIGGIFGLVKSCS